MTTRILNSTSWRLIAGALCTFATASCGGDLLRTGRAPVFLVIQNLTAGGQAVLRSDVVDAAGIALDDLGSATITVVAKNQAVPTTPLNAVTLNRYRVVYRRADGRNTPGVDVPYGFDGALNLTIQPAQLASAVFQIVRQQGKLEPPLRNLVNGGGQIVISTIAEVTFYGRDQNGNEVMVSGNMDVQFGDF
ncbi:MAG TPA: hypothetical protein VEA16_09080 [Vicinamibacterales bacterium]|nr:hypothetical protein [Vicinamibacterales bacterium]